MAPPASLRQAPLLALALLALVPRGTHAAEPVRVDFYMEALCPYCANFTLTQLAPLFSNGLAKVIELDVIPWGNARVNPDGSPACQHGPAECALNKLLGCALAQHPDTAQWWPFLRCMEGAALRHKGPPTVEEVAAACGAHAGLPPHKLLACYSGSLGDALQRLAAQRTGALKPSHQWVPWVVVNGVPLLDDIDSLARYICVAYTGHDRPKVCLDPPSPESSAAVDAAVAVHGEALATPCLAGAEGPQQQQRITAA